MERASAGLLLALASALLGGCVSPQAGPLDLVPLIADLPPGAFDLQELPPLLFNGARDVAATPAGPVVLDDPVRLRSTVGLVRDGEAAWFRIFSAAEAALASLEPTPDAPSGLVALVRQFGGTITVEAMDAATGETAWVREITPVPTSGRLFAESTGDRLLLGFAPRTGPSYVAAADAAGTLLWRAKVPGTLLGLVPHEGGAYSLWLEDGSPDAQAPKIERTPDGRTRHLVYLGAPEPSLLAGRISRLDADGHRVWERVLPPVDARTLRAAGSGLGLAVLADAPEGWTLRFDPQGFITHFDPLSCPRSCSALDVGGKGIVLAEDERGLTARLVGDRTTTGLRVPLPGLRVAAADEDAGTVHAVGVAATAPRRGLLLTIHEDVIADHLLKKAADAARDLLPRPTR